MFRKSLITTAFSIILLITASNTEAITTIIPVPPDELDFFIPLKGVTLDSDGEIISGACKKISSPDKVKLRPGDTSTGCVDLSFDFSPIPDGEITSAMLEIEFYDLDLNPYKVGKTLFFESALLTSDGTTIAILNEEFAEDNDLSLGDTNNAIFGLEFNLLVPGLFTPGTFSSPLFTLQMRLSAHLENMGRHSVTLMNTSESINSLILTVDSTPVPEPGTIILLSAGLIGLFSCKKRTIG